MIRFFLVLCLIIPSLHVIGITNDQAAEFIMPICGGTTDIIDETAIVILDPETIEVLQYFQDGFNYANKLILEEKGGLGFQVVKFKDDTGYIAGAISDYLIFDNINATMIGKRVAYLNAYTKAKKILVDGLKGFYIQREFELEKALKTVKDENRNIGSVFLRQTNELNKVISGLMRGFVTYQVSEKEENGVGQVFVSLAITPQTLASVNHMGHSIIITDDYLDCFRFLAADLNNDLDVPVGGKIILLPKQNKFAFVAFGSAIVRYSEDQLVQNEYYNAAVEASRMRSEMAMIELLNGIEEIWISGIIDSTRYSFGEEKLDMDRITNEVIELDEEDSTLINNFVKTTINEFLNIFKDTENYKYVIEGFVPPGTIQKTYETKNCEKNGFGWVYSMAVFYPEIEDEWEQFKQNMRITTLIEKAKEKSH